MDKITEKEIEKIKHSIKTINNNIYSIIDWIAELSRINNLQVKIHIIKDYKD